MCGFAGVFSKRPSDHERLVSMGDALRHRGPDQVGYATSEDSSLSLSNLIRIKSSISIGLVHRLLEINDKVNGIQPLLYDGRYLICFNGEIYNFKDLRSELCEFGHIFRTETDTEVIGAAYAQYGTECFSRFNGMWALVIIDIENQDYIISRDRMGEKPLYFYQDKEKLVFGSEVKAIYASGLLSAELNEEELEKYLKSGPSEWQTDTLFKSIKRIGAASYTRAKLENFSEPLREVKFWHLSVNTQVDVFKSDICENLSLRYYALLKDAVRIRIDGIEVVGITLSGGLDSASLFHLAKELVDEGTIDTELVTISSVYTDDKFRGLDESMYISQVLSGAEAKRLTVDPTLQDVKEDVENFSYTLESPPDSLLVPSYSVYRLASTAGIRVLLEGQGADEQLAGYHSYIIFYLGNLSLFRLPRVISYLLSNNIDKRIIVKGVLVKFLRIFPGKDAINYILRLTGARSPAIGDLGKILERSMTEDLQNLLHYGDRGSMTFSIESRLPFLDYRLVEFLASIPQCYKIHYGWTKFIARLAFVDKLPPSVVWRKEKLGWPAPERHIYYEIQRQNLRNSRSASHLNFSRRMKLFSEKRFRLELRKFLVSLVKVNFGIR